MSVRIEEGLHEPPGVDVSHAYLSNVSQLNVRFKVMDVDAIRDRVALEDDVEQRNEVHRNEHRNASIKTPDEILHRTGDPDKHEGDTGLDEDDRDAVEDLKQEEPLVIGQQKAMYRA